MPRVSMLIPEEALRLIDAVSGNRTAFMVEAAVKEAQKRRRELRDADVARICAETARRDAGIAREFDVTLLDGIAHLPRAE